MATRVPGDSAGVPPLERHLHISPVAKRTLEAFTWRTQRQAEVTMETVLGEVAEVTSHMRAVRHEHEPAALGQFLRQGRESRGLTLQQIFQETKIPMRHLEALEAGHIHVIPEGLYRRAEVRAYARAVGLNQSFALSRLERALASAAPSQVTPAPFRAHDLAASRTHDLIALGLIVTVVFAAQMCDGKPTSEVGFQLIDMKHVHSSDRTQSRAPVPEAPARPKGEAAAQALAEIPVGTPGDPATERAAPTQDSPGGLLVTTEPEGARVTVDGIGWGTTPITIRYLSPGNRRVRVTRDGFAPEERAVRVADSGSTSRLHISLLSAQ